VQEGIGDRPRAAGPEAAAFDYDRECQIAPVAIAIGLLTRVLPPAVVDAAMVAADRSEVRSRLLPARVTVY